MDLNNVYPKDDFPLPITELLMDATIGFGTLSFMDGFLGYNQIKMVWKIPFGLKNAAATYQRAVTIIFHDFLHNVVECYVDDLVVKTKDRENHPYDLGKVFQKLREHRLKMNHFKC